MTTIQKTAHRSTRREDLPDVETMLCRAIMDFESRSRMAAPHVVDTTTVEGTAEHRAKARSLLYAFAMRHFSSQVEAIRRDAVIQHLSDRARDRMHFRRILMASILGTLCATALLNALATYGIGLVEAATAATHITGRLAGLLGA